MSVQICDSCKALLVELLDKRMRRILDVADEELRFQRKHGNPGNPESGGSECFHLMEIKAIVQGHKTCGVYDEYGDPKTIKGPLFEAAGK